MNLWIALTAFNLSKLNYSSERTSSLKRFPTEKMQIENSVNKARTSDHENESCVSHYWCEFSEASYEVKNKIHSSKKLIVSKGVFELEMYISDH